MAATPPPDFDPQKAFSAPLPPPSGGQPSGQVPPPPRGPAPVPPYPQPYPPGYPPMMYPPPPPRHSFVRGIFVTLATTIFGLSLILNLYLLLFSGMLGASSGSRTTTLLEGDITQKIAVIPIKGIIDDGRFERFERHLKRVKDDPSVKAIVLEIDSPGGGVTASDQIYHSLKKFQAENAGLPVVSAMNALATSGGYYVACGSSHIVAQPTTLTGNVGVLLPRYNLTGMMEKIGVEENTVEASGSPFKNAGSMFVRDTPEETAYFQALIDGAYEQFRSVVQDGRGSRLTASMDVVANGKVYSGPEALKMGMVDQVGYLDDAIAYAAKTAGLSNPRAERYEEMPSFADLILGAKSTTHSAPAGVTLHISPEILDQMKTPRLMYLWRGQ